MDAREIKEEILQNFSSVERILGDLGMHHIQKQSGYYTFGLTDGDNPVSTTLYLDDLRVVAYTRQEENISDIIDLVTYIHRVNNVEGAGFVESLNWLCEEFGLKGNNYSNYRKSTDYSNPFLKFREDLKQIEQSFENIMNQQIDELQEQLSDETLKSYWNWNNTDFLKDNISYETQTEFEVGIDVITHRATIPIRDELGRLVGIKGRTIFNAVNEYIPKYTYLHNCEKSKLLYGLDKTLQYIKQNDEIIICESEKGVMQLWSYGIKNAVAVAGHNISERQIEKIIRLNVSKVVIAFDEDVTRNELFLEYKKLCNYADATCIVDKYHLLETKESPMDDWEKWKILYKDRRYKFNLETGEIV